MTDVEKRQQYIKFFIEDLLEHTLNRARDDELWHTCRSENLQQAYEQVPETYKLSEEFAVGVEIAMNRNGGVCTFQTKRIMDNIRNKADAERSSHLHQGIASMYGSPFLQTPHMFLLFMAVIATVSERVFITYSDSSNLIPAIVNGAVDSIMEANLGGTTDEIFKYINRVVPISDRMRMNRF